MKHRILWFAASFASVPVLLFACGGGRSDIDLQLADSAGAAGAAGKAGAAGQAGKGGTAGQGGAAGTAGSGTAGMSGSCLPGQQFECPCPGTALKGVQACNPDGKGLSACTGCPGGGEGGSAGKGGGGKGGGSGKGGSGDGGNEADGGKDFFDAIPIPLPDSGPVGECVNCLKENCDNQINGCYNNPDCVQGIQCAITDCFAGNILGGGQGGPGGPGGGPGGPGGPGGGLDFQCLLGCFGGDPTAVFSAVQAFQCITQTCGDNCGGGILGDGGFPLGGLGGGPFGGGQGGPGAFDPASRTIQGVRIPGPGEVPGYPLLQQALTPGALRR